MGQEFCKKKLLKMSQEVETILSLSLLHVRDPPAEGYCELYHVWKSWESYLSHVTTHVTLALRKVDSKEAEEAQKQIMKIADKDGDGVLSKEELDQAKAKVASQDQNSSPVADVAPPKDTEPQETKAEVEASHYQIVRGTLASILSGAAKRFVETKSFEEVDKDGDGVITQNEIAASLTEMQVDSKEAEEAQKQIMKIADKDGDGVLSKEELDQAKAKVASQDLNSSPVADAAPPKDTEPQETKAEVEASHYQIVRGTLASILSGAAKRFVETKSFEEVDKDGDGVITQNEIAASLTEMQVDSKEAEEAQKQIMKIADKDGDGVLSKEELDQAKAKVASQDQNSSPVADAAPPKDTEPQETKAEVEASHYQIVRGTLASILSGAAKRFVETKSFEEVDKDGDGVITQNEIAASLTEMQVDSKEAEEAQKQIMKIADKDGDGVLSKEELDQAKAKVASQDLNSSPVADVAPPKDTEPQETKAEVEASHYQIVRGTLASILSGAAKRFVETKSFEEVDKDGDGVITQNEIAASLTEMQVDSKEAEEAKQQSLGFILDLSVFYFLWPMNFQSVSKPHVEFAHFNIWKTCDHIVL